MVKNKTPKSHETKSQFLMCMVTDAEKTEQNQNCLLKPVAEVQASASKQRSSDKIKFNEKDNNEAASLAEYLIQKLKIIAEDTDMVGPTVLKPNKPLENENYKEDLSKYKELAEKFNTAEAVKLMLEMKNDFGKIGQVMDEYLFCLQAGIILWDYIGKPDEYKKVKAEKSLTLAEEEIITIQKLDEKLLEKVIEQNRKAGTDSKKPQQTGDGRLQDNAWESSQIAVPRPVTPSASVPGQSNRPMMSGMPTAPRVSQVTTPVDPLKRLNENRLYDILIRAAAYTPDSRK